MVFLRTPISEVVALKRLILLVGLLLILLQPSLQAQQKGPLAMEIMFQWTAAGGVAGAVLGFALWLTDPGNPNIKAADQMAKGAALGFILGSGYGLFILQNAVIIPVRNLVWVRDPLDPRERITSDPIAATSQDNRVLSFGNSPAGDGGWTFSLPLLNLRF